MGNRDINKMRTDDELRGVDGNNGGETRTLPKHDGAYWHTSELLSTDSKPAVLSNSATECLKWMLSKTMGSVDAFEHRRNELEQEHIAIINVSCVSPSHEPKLINGTTTNSVTVTDDEVAHSYISSCCPVLGIMSQCKFVSCLCHFSRVQLSTKVLTPS